MDGAEKETKEGEIEEEMDRAVEKRKKIHAYPSVSKVPSPEM